MWIKTYEGDFVNTDLCELMYADQPIGSKKYSPYVQLIDGSRYRLNGNFEKAEMAQEAIAATLFPPPSPAGVSRVQIYGPVEIAKDRSDI
jgi:hypothetical protein